MNRSCKAPASPSKEQALYLVLSPPSLCSSSVAFSLSIYLSICLCFYLYLSFTQCHVQHVKEKRGTKAPSSHLGNWLVTVVNASKRRLRRFDPRSDKRDGHKAAQEALEANRNTAGREGSGDEKPSEKRITMGGWSVVLSTSATKESCKGKVESKTKGQDAWNLL